MSLGDCLCDQEFDLDKPCLICRTEMRYAAELGRKVAEKDIETIKKYPISDRRLAVAATKRKNKNV